MEAKRVPLRLRAPIVIPCDITCTVLRDAVVDIGADGRIENVSTAANAPAWTGGVRTMSGILLPGLVKRMPTARCPCYVAEVVDLAQ
ncbi:hypothetical protein AB0C01_06620 [Micromonospora sp. NPDC048905]|uniref:hypothetical protein n=1 Tax=unclassified Micromonospora TaxID=2617518 RepID=UPI0033E6E9C0